MFASTKGKQQKYFRQVQCQEQCIDHIPNLVPWKMGGAGKGPGIGWSRVQPKYSEKLIYMQPAGFALTEGSNNRPTHFSREKPWGRGWYNTVDSDYGHTALDEFSTC